MEDFLGAAGIPTVAASDGLEALKRLGESRPCLILLDLWMPQMDGWRIREEQRRLVDRKAAN
jgi:CheY-like chemotaxis protein